MIQISNLSFAYAGGGKALDGISLKIRDGEFVLLTGPSGSGKTTLARCLNGIVPNFYGGKVSGAAFVDGKDAIRTPTREMARKVGFVFQDPEAMFVSSDVESEVRFGPACLGLRVDEMEMGVEGLRERSLSELSGGEKQKVAIASVLASRPKVLILDEPLSELDHRSADELLGSLKRLNRGGTTVIMIEQRTERVYGYATREIALERGKVAYDGRPRRGGRMPRCSVTESGEKLVKFENVSFSYGDDDVFNGLSADFREGEIVVLQGPNGSGKTTLLKLVMGLLKPVSGVVNVGGLENPSVEQTAGEVGYVFQNPDNHLFAETVWEEVEFILKNTDKRGDVEKTLRDFRILHYKKDYPRHLSGGEKQRVALASVAVARPKVLLLDEPTRGMDHCLKSELAEFLLHYTAEGNLVIMATHDEFMAACATRRMTL